MKTSALGKRLSRPPTSMCLNPDGVSTLVSRPRATRFDDHQQQESLHELQNVEKRHIVHSLVARATSWLGTPWHTTSVTLEKSLSAPSQKAYEVSSLHRGKLSTYATSLTTCFAVAIHNSHSSWTEPRATESFVEAMSLHPVQVILLTTAVHEVQCLGAVRA